MVHDSSRSRQEEPLKQNTYLSLEQRLRLLYLESICHRQLGHIDEAIGAYSDIAQKVSKEENHKMAKLAFGIVLLPLIKDRKVVFEYMLSFYDLTECLYNDPGVPLLRGCYESDQCIEPE